MHPFIRDWAEGLRWQDDREHARSMSRYKSRAGADDKIEMHHLAQRHYYPELVIPVCAKDHHLLTYMQKFHPKLIGGADPSKNERLAHLLRGQADYLMLSALKFYDQANLLTEIEKQNIPKQ